MLLFFKTVNCLFKKKVMKILFYSTKPYEQSYLEKANTNQFEITFLKKPLCLETAHLANGYAIISIFTGDDASVKVLESLHEMDVKCITTRAAGYDNIDIEKANSLGITITNVPAYSPYALLNM